MNNLIIGLICIFFGILNLNISIVHWEVIEQFKFIFSIICLAVGSLNIGIWIGEE